MFEQPKPPTKSGWQPPAPQSEQKDVPYFRFTLKGATVEFRATAPLTKEHLALVNAHLKAYEVEGNDPAQSKPEEQLKSAQQRISETQTDNVARVSFMITTSQKAELHEKGYDDDQIAKMKPAEAHKLLGLEN